MAFKHNATAGHCDLFNRNALVVAFIFRGHYQVFLCLAVFSGDIQFNYKRWERAFRVPFFPAGLGTSALPEKTVL
jgi:hypothetical protein